MFFRREFVPPLAYWRNRRRFCQAHFSFPKAPPFTNSLDRYTPRDNSKTALHASRSEQPALKLTCNLFLMAFEEKMNKFRVTPHRSRFLHDGPFSHSRNTETEFSSPLTTVHPRDFVEATFDVPPPQIGEDMAANGMPGESEAAVRRKPKRKKAKEVRRPQTAIISVTAAAATRMASILRKAVADWESGSQDGSPVPCAGSKPIGIRIGIKSKGCNGLSYTMSLLRSGEVKSMDEVVEVNGVTVVVDEKAVMFLVGSTVDFVTSDMGFEFTFKNPNQKSECGCGKSFSV